MDRLLKYERDIRRAKHFDIQNVSDYYFSYKDEEAWRSSEFTVAPPFDFFTTRYKLPDFQEAIQQFPELTNLEVLSIFRVIDYVPGVAIESLYAEDGEINPYPAVLIPHAKWHIHARTYHAKKNRVATPPDDWFMAVNEHGQIMYHRGRLALWCMAISEWDFSGISVATNSTLQVSLLALTFLSCRNTTLVNPPLPSRKRLPKKRRFETRYHTLKVNALGRKEYPNRGRSGPKMSHHIVRGHFREYGPQFGKGLLFGKIAGRVWVAAHTAGSKEHGKIEKDYKLTMEEQ